MTTRELCDLALRARKFAYVPYSHFAVGAAIRCADGTVYTGCNIENASFGPTICAERTAIFKAVSEGKKDFIEIAVCGAPAEKDPDKFCPPCGVCRQVMSEFCKGEFQIHLCTPDAIRTYTLDELLPGRFDLGEF